MRCLLVRWRTQTGRKEGRDWRRIVEVSGGKVLILLKSFPMNISKRGEKRGIFPFGNSERGGKRGEKRLSESSQVLGVS